jgi:hypothetical protein
LLHFESWVDGVLIVENGIYFVFGSNFRFLFWSVSG